MSLRWRLNGKLLCGAKSKPHKDDTYINDRLHYELSIIQKIVIPDKNEEKNGVWYWLHGECNRSDHEDNYRHSTFPIVP